MSLIPETLIIGKPCKATSELSVFIEIQTLQNQSLSGPELRNEITSEFGVKVSRTIIDLK
jgi:hypothetical protein